MTHDDKVLAIGNALKSSVGQQISLKKATVSHQVPHKRQETAAKLDISNLNEVLKIDVARRLAVAESGVTFAQLVKETMKYGLVPYVVPELETITLGGAVSGCSVESMSYKIGGFHDTCTEYEIITATGEVVTCSPERDADVFNMVHGAFGTLGVLSKITLKLCPAKPFVKLTYNNYPSIDEFSQAIDNEYKQQNHDFMDGIIHISKQFVLILADFVDEAPHTSDYTGQQVFYKSTARLEEDYLTTYDYFFRYDRECHWISRGFGLENPLLRRLFGKQFLGSTNMIRTAKRFEKVFSLGRPIVTVDTMMAFSKFNQFYKWYEKSFNFFPIWIVPYRMPEPYPWINPQFLNTKEQLYVDLAIYGMRQKPGDNYYQLMDEKLLEMHGLKTLISFNRYDEDTFWRIYDKKAYQSVKKKLDPQEILPELYAKTHRVVAKS